MTVYLVGAGPGDPDLLTRKAERLLATADVVVYDRLVHPDILAMIAPHAEKIDVGKVPGLPSNQELISELLRSLAVSHPADACIVRLKGGDPFVFGRGGEEAELLQANGLRFEMVPGISSSIAAPAYAGIPVTHRGVAPCFTVVTGHRRAGDENATNWRALAKVGGTIVILMGVAERAYIAAELMRGGMDPQTPVAAVHDGTRTTQETCRTVLAELGSTPISAPAVLVVGAVAAMNLDWFRSAEVTDARTNEPLTAAGRPAGTS
jgi:uroporphyrin-III C-methyltransferase